MDTSHFYPISKDEARAVVGIPAQDHMLLFVGRIEPLKGVDTLIRAMAQVRGASVRAPFPLYLAIIGGEPEVDPAFMTAEMARLQSLSRELGLDKMVIFLGKRSQDSLPYYYSAADAVVMPSHYELFGMVALEAMACGTPVVASQVGGLAFLVQDGVTGFSVPDDDPQTLGERLIQIISDAELRERLGKQAAEYAAQYAWGKITPGVVALYQNVLDGRQRSAHMPVI